MANTINDLYLKYVNKVGKTLENDRYFQYLFEMVQAGENVLHQRHQVLHKVVDERWLTTIEESLDAINTIIEKPRRYIKTNEEVVPVALARKISADSVRHLSMNTQFIASSEDGDIQPTKILNVSTEETYDLYENRFIYHLIQRLVTFIDKRTDVIFWSTGDETTNVLSYQSKVDDAYEEISYKLEMTVKNRQSFAENDSDNMSVFMRIDRVRRLVLALRNSSFCSIMAGCAKVRSPIQRTNLIMKDPNYRTCYQLWQFLERYDEVGYTIEAQDSTLEFDEEYMIQMYTNLITNYTVFKSLLEADPRKLDQAPNKRRRVIKPKFIKKIEEQFVDDPNIEEVEIRRVFLEEVTQAQLDAEAKLAEETKAKEEALEELDRIDGEMIGLQQQVGMLMAQLQEAQMELEELQEQKDLMTADLEAAKEAYEEAEAAKDAAQALAAQTRQEADAEIAKTKEEAETQIAQTKAQAEAEVSQTKAQAETEIAQTKAQAEAEVSKAQKEAEDFAIRTRRETAESVLKIQQEADEKVAQISRKAADAVAEAKKNADAAVSEAMQNAEQLVTDTRREADERIARTEQKAAADLAELQREKEEQLAALKDETQAQLTAMKENTDRQVRTIREEADRQITSTKTDADQRIAATKADAEERIAATKAEAQQMVDAACEKAEAEIARTRQEASRTISEVTERVSRESAESIAQTEAKAKREVEEVRKLRNDAMREAEQAKEREQAALRRAEEEHKRAEEEYTRAQEEAKARAKAEERAQANTLSKRILAAWDDRRARSEEKKKNNKDDEQ